MNAQNSLVLHASQCISDIFMDIKYAYRGWEKDRIRDRDRIISQLGRHGLRVIYDYLPSIAKHFDKCLDQGYILPYTGFLGRTKKKVCGGVGPIFLGRLYQYIFDNDAKLRSDACIDAIASIRQVLLGFKKLYGECTDEATESAVNEFVDIERDMRVASHSWNGDATDICWNKGISFLDPSSSRDGRGRFTRKPSQVLRESLGTLHNVCDAISSLLGDFHTESARERPKHGPGAVSNLPISQWKYYFHSWSARLEATFPYITYASANEALVLCDNNALSGISYDSRLISVPKTLKSPRLIAAEPVENQWIQQLILSQISERIRNTPISSAIQFNSQEKNQILAKKGSVTGDISTVDLSSASDRLSCWTVERMFRRNTSLLDRLYASRTQCISMHDFNKGRLTLKKFATMGSACIFPIQTVAYTMMAVACVLGRKKVTIKSIREAAKQVQVFGDDIVIPTKDLDNFVEMLTFFGLKVNVNKTFSKGNFRESCGVDAFRGHDVSPVYIKHLPTERLPFSLVNSIVETSNNLHKAGYWRLANRYQHCAAPFRRQLRVVANGSGVFGLMSFVGAFVSRDTNRIRWNKDLQRAEVQVLRFSAKNLDIQTQHPAQLLDWFLYKEKSNQVPTDGFNHSPSSYTRTGMRARLQESSTLRKGWEPI